MIHGHESLVESIMESDARALLFSGPESVGKWTVAEHLVQKWGVTGSDIMAVERLTVADAREAVQFTSYAPLSSPVRVFLTRLGSTSEAAQNILLKAVEEAPETSRFIFVGRYDLVLPTLFSRCWTAFFTYLDVESLTAILEDRGFKSGQARVWAERGEGQVKKALAFKDVNEAKPLVTSVIKAFREKDPALLDKAADGWTEAHTDLLVAWCNETLSRHWVVFPEEEEQTRGRGLPMRILVALHADIRPKLVIKSTLADLLRSMS